MHDVSVDEARAYEVGIRAILLVQLMDDLRTMPIGGSAAQPQIREFREEWPRLLPNVVASN